MENILDSLQGTPLAAGMDQIAGASNLIEEMGSTVLIAVLVLALLNCFLGLKLVRIWGAILGLALGTAAGFAISSAFGLEWMICLGIGAVVGIILAILAAKFYHTGVFLFCWVTSAVIIYPLLNLETLVQLGVTLGAGLVIALLTLKLVRPIVIVLSSVQGGLTAGTAIAGLLGYTDGLVRYFIGIGILILGIIIQLVMESHKRGKLDKKKAHEIRQKESTETEVEKARALLDNLDDASEDEE